MLNGLSILFVTYNIFTLLTEIQVMRGVHEISFPFVPQYYSVFLLLRRLITKLSSEVGCGEVTNPK